VDINAAYSNFTDAQMSWTAIGCPAGKIASLEETPASNGITIYPNPATADFRIRISGFGAAENVTLLFYDLQGKQLLENKIKTKRSVLLNTAQLGSQGNVFVVKAMGASKAVTQKLVVIR
jgi:hypothetical protein